MREGNGRFVGRVGEGRLAAGSKLGRWARMSVIATLVTLAVGLMAVASASASSFTARGSVEQVDVTGVAPNAQVSLLRNKATVATQNADSLGGVLFRTVKPGAGYKVSVPSTNETSEAITVHTGKSAPWDPSVYNQEIPDNGYTYLKTRDGTELAIDVHPPTSPAGEPGSGEIHLPPFPVSGELRASVSDDHRVLGLRLREPRRTGKRHRGARQPDGLRGGRREHARDRLLWWRLRLL